MGQSQGAGSRHQHDKHLHPPGERSFRCLYRRLGVFCRQHRGGSQLDRVRHGLARFYSRSAQTQNLQHRHGGAADYEHCPDGAPLGQ